jgi:carboxyl-terminal processing protease
MIALLRWIALFIAMGHGPGDSLAVRAWQIIDSTYVTTGFDRQRWQLARADTSVRDVLRHLGDRQVSVVRPTTQPWLFAEVTGQAHVGVGLAALLSLDISEHDHQLVVVTVMPGTPASRAGLRTGDEVRLIDGVATDTMTLVDAAARLHGPEGTSVVLGIHRRATDFPVTLTRRAIAAVLPVTIDTTLDGGVAYIALRQFTTGSDTVIRRALTRRPHVTGVILDLRDNPGGDLGACRGIAGLFIGQQPFARRIGRGEPTPMLGTGQPITSAPLMVLVNRGTASAAEVLAAGLRDTGRARLVGEPTFGKALIHSLAPLDSSASLLLTVGQVETLKGQPILGVGLTPDMSADDASALSVARHSFSAPRG